VGAGIALAIAVSVSVEVPWLVALGLSLSGGFAVTVAVSPGRWVGVAAGCCGALQAARMSKPSSPMIVVVPGKYRTLRVYQKAGCATFQSQGTFPASSPPRRNSDKFSII